MKKKIAIVVSDFNKEITSTLLEDLVKTFSHDYKITSDKIEVFHVEYKNSYKMGL